ncbi:FAD/NAD(P)-binding protein [Amycolatopsis decaplanina]|uniref:Hydrogenase/ sulfur reductase n=1 Tax=Amycolatopsis decaplanina DSM 44594 TaxID=1284240 RepID=M2Y0M2_9PSEU|nr:FAD/NAD(P)-binding protein [Amycolatopsis decaplanina]EME55070.1 hydrogenase/ sulfur reductase [Amycolatopsis decaplanina DSM 44594]
MKPGDWLPLPYRVSRRVRETGDVVTLTLAPDGRSLPGFLPGQFAMLYAPGVGEVPISVSAIPGDGTLVHTIRAVGAVSGALHDARTGTVLGVRGPFGTPWRADGREDLLVVAGGIGLAPLRPVIRNTVARSPDRRLVLIAGARTPADLPYRRELDELSTRDGADVVLTVDRAAGHWTGRVGFVTEPLAVHPLDPDRTTALLCGPEPMMRFCARTLLDRGVPAERIEVSLERNMQCGIGSCGHCQLGPLLLCRTGPVVGYHVAEPLLMVKEL